MPKLDRYLSAEFARAVLAALVVLAMVSLGGVFADVIAEMARGKLPPSLLLSQLGLRLLGHLPMILPLALLLGVSLAVGRLYRDSEMFVLTAIGVGPQRLLRPLLWVVVPVLVVIALCSLWLGPMSIRLARSMVAEANRNLLVAGLEPGRFTALANGGVAYVGQMSADGTRLQRVFLFHERNDRIDVATAQNGELSHDHGERLLTLLDGFRVEGPAAGTALDYRLMRYRRNELVLPPADAGSRSDAPELQPTSALLRDPSPPARAELHWRLASPLLALALALLAVPMARSLPRQSRHGAILLAFLVYLVNLMLIILGTRWLAEGRLPTALGLWWLLLPLLAVAVWRYVRDGQLPRRRGRR
ncbi:LPS export ABC transporter permease LptF [Thermomonas hydrothermalis]|uniref:Lipopolysaccharide export system permease protein LptF n=1 Tax=Thermomonas hydrothermalis TaxID=213588 RepID=A0A1M4VNP9_9GAMM|nr:LPS export ABC transporter permease LptF [Thermomonas hydrothermalis]SHE70477.1 lipopolysaccharide export system permease protein [Thermomonas hydrothermalis]